MAPPRRPAFDDQALTRYLLGLADEPDTDRLDQLSITDDELAARVRDAENDLVDAYARGELQGEPRERFAVRYLASPADRQRVRFAEALGAYTDRPEARASAPAPARWTFVLPDWAWAAAAVLAIAGSAVLFTQNARLRREVAGARVEQANLQRREQDLRAQVERQTSSGSSTAAELARVRESLTRLQAGAPVARRDAPVFSFVLLPPTRGIAAVPVLPVPRGTREVNLRLVIEAADFPRYRLTVRDATSNAVVWRSTPMPRTTTSEGVTVSATLAASLLRQKLYTVELSGLPRDGTEQIAGTYPVRVVLQ